MATTIRWLLAIIVLAGFLGLPALGTSSAAAEEPAAWARVIREDDSGWEFEYGGNCPYEPGLVVIGQVSGSWGSGQTQATIHVACKDGTFVCAEASATAHRPPAQPPTETPPAPPTVTPPAPPTETPPAPPTVTPVAVTPISTLPARGGSSPQPSGFPLWLFALAALLGLPVTLLVFRSAKAPR